MYGIDNWEINTFNFNILYDDYFDSNFQSLPLPKDYKNLFVVNKMNDALMTQEFIVYSTSIFPRFLIERGFTFRIEDDQGGNSWDYIDFKYDKEAHSLKVVRHAMNARLLMMWN